jgi:hypothetical protein
MAIYEPRRVPYYRRTLLQHQEGEDSYKSLATREEEGEEWQTTVEGAEQDPSPRTAQCHNTVRSITSYR